MENNKSNKTAGYRIRTFFAAVGAWISLSFKNFIDSFKYNPSKLAGWLIAIPGILLGFCLVYHFAASGLFVSYNVNLVAIIKEQHKIDIPVQDLHSNFQLFALIVLGAIALFSAAGVIGKRNLGSSIQSALCSIGIVIFGIFWIMNFYRTDYILNIAKYTETASGEVYNMFSKNNIISQICVYLSMISVVAGTILSFIMRDRTYKKDVF